MHFILYSPHGSYVFSSWVSLYFLFSSFLLLVSHICVPVCIYGLLEPENIQSRRDGGVSVLFLLCLLAPYEIM